METPRGSVERRQRVLRVARDTLDTVGLPTELDETFYESLRATLVSAGATDADLDEVASLLVTWIVDCTDPDSADRFEQFDLIGHHLVCTDMQIEIGPEDTDVHVEFPRRPKIH